ncbi:MAG: hypothetical protein IPF53_08230 [Blastocatellia bacterium]|nr:hypothetical protein [Blastocatellia bacterium]
MSTETPSSRRAVEKRYYIAAAVGSILIVFAGFARTYYLKGFSTPLRSSSSYTSTAS